MDKDKFLELSYSEKLKYVSRKKVDPGKVSEPRPRRKITFKSLATQIIGNFNNERKQDIILEIESITKVNKSRAENGFNMMLEQNVISWGVSVLYMARSVSLPT